MSGENSLLRWKEHTLFPYTCGGCVTKHPKGYGIYLDQSGPRTITYDSPQCSQQALAAENVPKASAIPREIPLSGNESRVAVSPPPTSDRPHQVTLTVDLQGGRSVEVALRVHGDGVERP